jgi:hypothetical protein
MAKAFRMFPVTLRPGVTAADFEQFLREDWVEVFSSAPGVRSYVSKAAGGRQAGQYLMVVECDRVATRDLYWPDGKDSDIWKQVSALGLRAPEAIRAEERWPSLVIPEWADDYTDWELVAQ